MKVKINYSAMLEIPETEEYVEGIADFRKSNIEDTKEHFCKEIDGMFYNNDPKVKLESNFDMIID